AGADWRLPGDERGAAGRAALLPIPISEPRPFPRDAVNVWRLVAHDAAVVTTRVEPADVIAHDHENVGLLGLRLRVGDSKHEARQHGSGNSDAPRPGIGWF